MNGKKIVVLDLETTGFDIYNDKIIEFAALCIQEEQEEPEVLNFLCSPGQLVSGRILRLTGLTQEELDEAQPIQVYEEEILKFLQGAVLVGHNVDFDLSFLQASLNIHLPNEIWDTLEITRILFPNLPKYRLSDLIRFLNLDPIERSHRALPDVQATWNILQKCWEKGLSLDLSFYQKALPLLISSRSLSFFQSLEKEIKKKFPERLIATDLILNNDMGIFEQFQEEQDEEIPTSFTWIEECFSKGGILERKLKGYESRLGQVKMAKAVGEALMNSNHLVSEAGTGTGKSYAYLIPSLWWSKKTGKKVVVATHTIPLQEQLFKKDLPILAEILPFSFQGEILKGKGNYICLKKWLAFHNNFSELGLEARLATLSVLVWLRETKVGDWQEIAQIPYLDKIWGEINAEEESCIPGKCSQANRCFMLQARKKAESADLIIVNHSLLFSDIKTERNILPEYHQLIIDEAHHLHQAALQQLGNEISLEQITQTLNLLSRPLAGSFYGNIKVRSQFWEQTMPLQTWEEFRRKLEEIPEASGEVQSQAQEVFSSFEQILGKEISLRLTPQLRTEKWWDALEVQIENLQGRLSNIIRILKDLHQLVNSLDDEESQSLAQEIGGRVRKFEEIKECFTLAWQFDEPMRVSWLENSRRLVLKTAPVDVSDILRENLFKPLDSVILTSATLSISNSFEHFLEKIGLSENVSTLIVESPFAYEEQMQLVVVQDLIKENYQDLFDPEEVADFITAVGERMEGRTLVLLTSHRFLREIYTPLSQRLAESELELLAQGIDGGRQALLESFRQNPKSILLGANSFWEGIDIPGEELSCVILLKLPFGPPNQPLTAARSEYLEAQGKNSFYELLLPEAVIRFKQGVGRLIRSKTDRGLVIICDNRVAQKRYGRMFLNSLPLKTHIRTTQGQILDKIDLWFDEEREKDFL